MRPLENIRILDLSRYLPGPFSTQILADFGAEVIKLEEPVKGELGRGLEPLVGGTSSRYYTVNRNKGSITLNLKEVQGKDLFRRLIPEFDVLFDQFRPGFMEEIGLGYEELKKINPRLIYCALSGYGQTGPYKKVAGHDLNYLSLAGVTGLNGNAEDNRPSLSGVQMADIAGGGLYATIGLLLAVIAREKTGEGQLVDVSMLDGSISLLQYTLGEWSGWGALPQRGEGVLAGGYACYNIYRTKDEKAVSLGAVEGKFWAGFCTKLGLEQYIEKQYDRAAQKSIIEEVAEIILTKNRDEWVDFFADSDICFTPVLDMQEMTEHPQVKAREMIQVYNNQSTAGQNIYIAGTPLKLSATPGKAELKFAEVGSENMRIFESIGLSPTEIEELEKKGII